MIQYPPLKKTIKKFVMNENGSITKDNLIKIGVLLVGAVGFMVQKNVLAAHASQTAAHASGHNSGGDILNDHSSCLGAHDNAHAQCTSGHLNQGTAYTCNAHRNQLSLITNTDGSVTGTHIHGVTHSNTGSQNTAARDCASGHSNANSRCRAYLDGALYQADTHCSHGNHSSHSASHSQAHASG